MASQTLAALAPSGVQDMPLARDIASPCLGPDKLHSNSFRHLVGPESSVQLKSSHRLSCTAGPQAVRQGRVVLVISRLVSSI